MTDYTYDSSIHGYFTSSAVQQDMNRYWHQHGNPASANEGERLQSNDKSQDHSHQASPVQMLYSDPAYNNCYQGGQPKLSRPSHLVEINCEPPSEVSELTHLREWATHSQRMPAEKEWEDKLSQNLQLYKEKHPVVSSHHPSTTEPPCAQPRRFHSSQPLSSLPGVDERQQNSETQTVVLAQQSYWQQCSAASDKPPTTASAAVTHNNSKRNGSQSKSNEQELLLPLHSDQANADNQSCSLFGNVSEKSNLVGPSNPNKSTNQHEQKFNHNTNGDFGLAELFQQSGQNLCVEDGSKPPRIPQLDFPLEFWSKEMWFWHDEKYRLTKSLHRRHKKKGYWSEKIHERAKEATRRFKHLYRQCGEDLSTRTDLDFEDLKRRKLEGAESKNKMKKLLHPPPEAVPSTSETTQPPSRRHWQKETKLSECARQQAVARVMEKVFSNNKPFSSFHGLKDVVKKANVEDGKLDKYNWEISCRSIDNSISFGQNPLSEKALKLQDDNLHARSPVALRRYSHYGSNLLHESLNSARNALSHHPEQPTRPPNRLNWPPNTPNCPPNWHNRPPNWHNRPPNWHNRPPNMHFGPTNLRYNPPKDFQCGSRFLDRDPDLLRRSPVPIQKKAGQKSHVVDVGVPCLYSMVDLVEDNMMVPVEKHLFSGCLTQPHNSKGGPFKRDSFIVPPLDNFSPLRDGPIVNRRDVGRGALAAPSKLVCYIEGELGLGGTQGVFSGKFLKANYFRTPLYDPFTSSGLPENLEQHSECGVDIPQQTRIDTMEILDNTENITTCSFGKATLSKRQHNLMSANDTPKIAQKRPSSATDDAELHKLLRRVQGNLQNMKQDNHCLRNQIETCRAPQDWRNLDMSKRLKTLDERKPAHKNNKDVSEIYRTLNKRCVEDLAQNVIKKLTERREESNVVNDDITKKSILAKLINHGNNGAVDACTDISHVENGVARLSSVVTEPRSAKPNPENAHLKKFNESKSFPGEQSAKEQTSVHPMSVDCEERPALENKGILVKNYDCSPARPTENIPRLFCETEHVPPSDHRSRTKVLPGHNTTNASHPLCPNLSELLRRIEVNLDKKMSDKEQEQDRDLILSGVRQSRLTAEVTGFDGRQKEGRSREGREMAGISERFRGRLGDKVDHC